MSLSKGWLDKRVHLKYVKGHKWLIQGYNTNNKGQSNFEQTSSLAATPKKEEKKSLQR